MIVNDKGTKKYSYAEYLLFDDGERWEIIKGDLYLMVPAPTIRHQSVIVKILTQLTSKLPTCKVLPSPIDVLFPDKESDKDEDIFTIVQPDIVVVCDKDKIKEKHIKGAPNLIVEVLSPSTATRDLVEKKELYETYGVDEYWVIDPLQKKLIFFALSNGSYRVQQFGNNTTVKSKLGIEFKFSV